MRMLALAMLAVVACGRATPPPPAGGARLVTLMPSGTEVVAALGATAELVGVDRYSKYPPEVAALPRVGTFTAPDLEAIVRLHPTLVIVDSTQDRVAAALRDHGIPSVACAMLGLHDVTTGLRAVGDAIGRRREADAAIAAIDAAVAGAAAHRPAHHPRVLAIIDREAGGLGNLVAAGPGSYVDELLAVVGGDNVLAGTGVRYPKISTEEVLRAKPEVILDLSGNDTAAWTSLGLTANARSLTSDYLRGPSPRVAAALAELAAALR